MSETTAENPSADTSAAAGQMTDNGVSDQSAATDTGAEKDWKTEAEKWRTHAQKHEALWKAAGAKSADAAAAAAEVNEWRQKAAKFEEFEESQKTELQKAAEKAAAAEAKAAELEMRAMRAEVAINKGVPAELLSGATEEELIASADALVAFRGEAPKPDFGAGGRGTDVGTERPRQLSQEDVKRLYAEKKYGEIEKAREEGRLDALLGGK